MVWFLGGNNNQYRKDPESQIFRPAPEVRASMNADGVAFLNIATGSVLVANRVGARMWREAAGGKSLREIVADVSEEFGVSEAVVRSDAERFLRELTGAGILVRDREGLAKAR